MNLGCDQLASFLKSKGISPEGIDSVRGNGISGDMFMQFCEEDIRDAFTVFKDRFTVRKVIRELKLGQPVKPSTQSPHSAAQSVTQSSRPSQQPPRVSEQRTLYQNNSDQHRPFSSPNASMKSLHDRQLFMPPTETSRSSFGSGGSQSINMSSRLQNDSYSSGGVKRRLSIDHIKREPPETRTDNTSGVCIDLRPKSQEQKQEQSPVFPYGSPQLMNATVSSTEEELRTKGNKSSPLHKQGPGIPYPVCLTQVIPSSSPAQSQHSPTVKAETSQQMMPMADEKHHGQQSQSQQAMPNPHRYDESGAFMLSLVSSSISRFSGEELLGKKPVRGRPTEAQRLGTVLIRNAAQSVRIWDSAPLWKDITHEKRDGFMQYVISTAPQLAAYSELVWNRLREALQNRRKYLLDKETGRRVLKSSPLLNHVKDDSAIPSINIADVRSLIDLTEQHEQDDNTLADTVKTEDS
ncbi:uncharacterized protein LOC132552275 [Ylistrum balloti]|uniref:uncharacterized protein LOC132552275 n=1 Tax=Ylistrum balloti TaxID=509963 RepID=UPI002905A6ED|nr:uncharacterized protein LOC132552275 [Ylistrum balloti]XP_060072420.1 uncharacterized protein LOC132552275 [Ylistrum balloti]